ncbi:hypothetical protein F4677DRAFT_260399 [Hypoxylon crocopeplum]|nr:hypothetical protein F4677DRAFT_260399 [Hypoxylon crocopeplum]
MSYRFPKTINAARVATFVSTAAWIQGTSASSVSLPEEALNNFLRRHGVTTVSARQAPAPEEEEEEEEEDEEESDDSQSSVDTPGSTPSDSMDDEEETPSLPDPPQAGVTADASGQPAIGSADPPALSMGAKVAIGVWSAVAVVAIAGLIFFFARRRRRRLAQEEINSLRDEELARSQMSEVGMPPPPAMEAAYLRGGGVSIREASVREPSVRAPSGQWMPTPPWQDDPPTWRDSHPWRQSQSTVIAAPNGLPSGPRPPFAVQSMQQNRKPEFDRQTEVTAETESTIFAYR